MNAHQKSAQAVLARNRNRLQGGLAYTKPSNKLYPAQWSWDSMFIAIGYAAFDLDLAIAEIDSLFSAQWTNGLVPHIVFHQDDVAYFPGPDLWNSYVSPFAPRHVRTSGIVQPPIHALAVRRVYKEYKKRDPLEAKKWLEQKAQQLLQWHEYCYNSRDPEESGLITIYHPWESGMDNSPRWDAALRQIDPINMQQYKRHDTSVVDPAQRPSNEEYGRYLALVDYLRFHNYNDTALYGDCPFKIKDVAFTSLLAQGNRFLKEMLHELGRTEPIIDTWLRRTCEGLTNMAFSAKNKRYHDYNLVRKKQVAIHTVASYFPLISGVLTGEQDEQIISDLQHACWCNKDDQCSVLVPSVANNDPSFQSHLYWRGPVWFNVNWLLYRQLKHCNKMVLAKIFKDELIRLVEKSGFREHYHPLTDEPQGAEDFSWTAALYLDLMTDV